MSATNSIYMCFFCAVTLNFASFDHFVVYQDGDVNLIANHMNNTVTAGRGTGACSETEARPLFGPFTTIKVASTRFQHAVLKGRKCNGIFFRLKGRVSL